MCLVKSSFRLEGSSKTRNMSSSKGADKGTTKAKAKPADSRGQQSKRDGVTTLPKTLTITSVSAKPKLMQIEKFRGHQAVHTGPNLRVSGLSSGSDTPKTDTITLGGPDFIMHQCAHPGVNIHNAPMASDSDLLGD